MTTNDQNNITLKNWLNPYWFSIYQSGKIQEHCKYQPFKYIILEDLLKPEIYELIEKNSKISNPEQGPGNDEADKEYTTSDSGRSYSPLSYFPAIRFFLGVEFLDFLKKLTGDRLRRPADDIPQIRIYPETSPGLRIHNDIQSPFEYGALFYLNTNWSKAYGGELNLWKLDRQNRMFKKFMEIPPTGNTFVMIRCSENSWHNVEPVKADRKRKNIFLQYKVKTKQTTQERAHA